MISRSGAGPSNVRCVPGAVCAIMIRRVIVLQLIALLVACAVALGADSSEPAFARRVWRTQDGLPENRVHALAQTPDGYLWIGTSGGLARFDGARFVVFARINTPAMMGDDVRALAVGRDGSLWIATDGGGLLHHKDGRFRSIGPSEGLANEFVGAVL